MSSALKCRDCGAPLAPDAPQGLCPACLMKVALASGTNAGEDSHRFTPPTIEELGARFPQLELLEFIGRGGMGAVYKARQKVLERIVALKVLPPDIGQGGAFAERFAREAKALAKLNHPGIVTIHDFGRADGLYFFLMEYVDGVSLRQLLAHSRVSPREALAIVPQICDALQFAHDQGIVHRDIKPENILLDRHGRVKVADFGLVKLVRDVSEPRAAAGEASASAELTEAGKIMGTPNYMSPEQRRNPAEVDHRADIYALGVVFYQMLTGELPGKPLEPPSKKVLLDVRLDEVVLRALEKEPTRRYQQVSQVRTAIETIAHSQAPEVRGAPAASSATLVVGAAPGEGLGARKSELEQPFDKLVDRYVDLVHSVATRRVADARAAAEITQAVFLIVARRLRTLPPRTCLAGWLYHTACLAVDTFERVGAAAASCSSSSSISGSPNGPVEKEKEEEEEEDVWPLLARHLEDAMLKLQRIEREVLVLRYFEHKPLQQVGLELGLCDFVVGPYGPLFISIDRTSSLAPAAVEHVAGYRAARALERLRGGLRRRGVELTSEQLAQALSARACQPAPAGLADSICATALKGSAVAPSILTLVKGTLKLMTWLKLRFAAGLTAGFVLVAGAIAFSAVAAGSRAKAPDIQGTWEGVADVGAGAEGKPQKLTIVLRFNKTKDGYGATADEVEVGQANLPIEHVTYNYPVVHLDYTTLKSFTGTINTNATEMTFNEGDIHIVLKRTEHPMPVPEKLADDEFAPRADFPLQGYWKGKLGTLPLAWKIARQANGTFRAELDNPNQGANGQPATVVFDPPNVELRLLTRESIYRAALSTNQDELTGNWLSAGGSTPMTVRRADYEAELAQERGRDFSPTSASDVRGHWMSVAKIGDKALRAYLDIASLPDGSYYACIRCPDFSNPGVIPATTFQCTPPKLHGEWKWVQSGIVLDCELVHSRLVGSVRLNDTDFPVTFERIKALAAR